MSTLSNDETGRSIYHNLLPFIKDELITTTSTVQDGVADMCKRFMTRTDFEIEETNSHGITKLQRSKHLKFIKKTLETYPAQFQGMDASRPWILYWALAVLNHLDDDVMPYKDRLIQTFNPFQNVHGGFGGGHGQLSHVAPSYAAILSLAMVDSLDMIDRQTMWHWLGQLKQPDGSFAMAVDGEIDVRGAYCAMTIIALLNLPLDLPNDSPAKRAGLKTFTDELGSWVGKCQTYEGGIGGAPGNEAHGAYTFCGLACLSILDSPARSVPTYLNVDRLVSWLSYRQTAPEGGCSGRTNKLVDACYSHWVGGCWSIIESITYRENSEISIWNREALMRYSLCCSQTKQGGFRDKPGARQDGYHTCYSTAGLSAAQNTWIFDDEKLVSGINLPSAFKWKSTGDKALEFDETDAMNLVHPIFVIPPVVVTNIVEKFSS